MLRLSPCLNTLTALRKKALAAEQPSGLGCTHALALAAAPPARTTSHITIVAIHDLRNAVVRCGRQQARRRPWIALSNTAPYNVRIQNPQALLVDRCGWRTGVAMSQQTNTDYATHATHGSSQSIIGGVICVAHDGRGTTIRVYSILDSHSLL